MSTGTRVSQRGAVLLGCAGGMLVVAGALAASYYVVSTRSEARAATVPAANKPETNASQPVTPGSTKALDSNT